jgi:alkyldihydroxyacetonephosphate synthase
MDIDGLIQRGVPIIRDPLHLHAYRRDMWPRDTLAWRNGEALPDAPTVVASPTRAEEVAEAIDWASENGVTVVPYGAGSGVCGGARGRSGSLVIDLKRMNRVLSFDGKTRWVHVESGILGQHLEDQLAGAGWMTAHSPSSIACSTAGGYIATRSAGQFSSRYGVFDDMLIAAAAQTPTGRLLTGAWTPEGQEDLLPVLCGSEGGLGVVTDMLIRIQPLPNRRWLRGYAFDSVEEAWDAMRGLMQADLWPSVLRLYDPLDTKIGGKTKAADSASKTNLFGWLKAAVEQSPDLQRHLISIPLAVPRLLNRIGKGLGDEVLLIVGFEGPHAVVDATIEAAAPILSRGRDLGSEPGEQWYAHRHDVSYKLAPVFMTGAFADTMEVAATWDKLPKLYQQVRDALGRHCAVMAHFSHAYPEGCSIYFSFAGRGRLKTYDAAWTTALEAARAAGGTVTHHHGVGVLKASAAAQEAGAAVRVWNTIKREVDPDGLMNPGRPFPEDASTDQTERLDAPSSPGPVYSVNLESRLARVDAMANPTAIQEALQQQGLTLRILPDRPFHHWLPQLERGALQAWQCPVFGVQARFTDGTAARIGIAPRSAAGPDLRIALIRRATTEWVEVAVRPTAGDISIMGEHPQLDARDVRPVWSSEECWGFSATQKHLAEVCLHPHGEAKQPSVPPAPKQ